MNEDFNEFSSWDCAGAATMLALVPAVFYYVNSEHDLAGTAVLAAIALGVGVFVLVIAFLTDARIVSRILQFVGMLLCVAYWIFAVHSWYNNTKFTPPEPNLSRENSQPRAE